MKIEKVEAAKRQIEMAIRLLFQNEDPVGIHTITAASFRIVCDLAVKNESSFMSDQLDNLIRPEKKGEFWSAINKPVNFFKHADKDPYEVLEHFSPELNDIMLLLACFYYSELQNKPSDTMNAYILWYSFMHPEAFKSDSKMKEIFADQSFEILRSSRKEMLETGKHVFKHLGIDSFSI